VILVDTSAWVEFDRATDSAVDARLTGLIAADGGEIGVCEPVLMEMLAGARSDRRADDLRRLLLSFGWLGIDVAADFEGAARIYRRCRSDGITPRGLVDCLIVAIALRTGSTLLTADSDRYRMASVVPISLEPV
jgi:predicted nucleic acid-binding protein